MKVILKKDVPNLGHAGDIKEVKNGYARNYLIPRGMVMTADAKSQKQVKFLEQVQKQKIAKRKKTAMESAQTINGKEFSLTVKTGENGKLFGSVTNLHIQRELENNGFIFDKRTIILEDPIKTLGIYPISLKLHEGVTSQIKVRVQDETGSIEFDAVPEETEAPKAAPAESVEENTAEQTDSENSASEEE